MRVAIALALTLVVALPAAAFPPPEAPLVDSIPFDESGGYAAWRVWMPADSFFSVWMLAEHEDLAFGSFALWFVDPVTYEFSALINPTWYAEGGHESHVEGALAGELSSEVVGEYPWPVEMRVDYQPFFDQEWLIVALGAFDGNVAGELRAYADGGASIVASTRGDAFLFTERDFEGTANVVAREELPVREAVAEAKVQLDAVARTSVSGRLFASFWAGDHLGLQETSTSPPAPIDMTDAYLFPGAPPGEYEFRIDQNVDWHDNQPTCRAITFERCWRVPAFVVGADITVP